jgi:hypothetical protein
LSWADLWLLFTQALFKEFRMSAIVSDPQSPAQVNAPEVDAAEGATKEKPTRAALVKFLADGAERLTVPELPEGYNSSKHKPLAKSDFIDEPTFLRFKAHECQRKADRYLKEAETVEKLGNAADRTRAKKLISMHQRMMDLAKELSSGDSPLDLAEILGADAYAALMGGAQSTGEN